MIHSKLSALAVGCVFALSSAAYAQATGSQATTPPRDLNAEAAKLQNTPPKPPEVQKEKRDKIQTKEQQQRAMQEYQTRSASSSSGGPATVDKNAPKAAKGKATSKMTREEQNARLREAQKASTP